MFLNLALSHVSLSLGSGNPLWPEYYRSATMSLVHHIKRHLTSLYGDVKFYCLVKVVSRKVLHDQVAVLAVFINKFLQEIIWNIVNILYFIIFLTASFYIH